MMMKKSIFVVVMSVFLVLCVNTSIAGLVTSVWFHDGQVNTIDHCLNSPPDYDMVVVISDLTYGTPTTVNFVDGAEAVRVEVYDTSIFNMYDGVITGEYSLLRIVEGLGHSQSNIYGGTIPGVEAWDDSNITIYGTDFNYPYGNITDTSGTLTGTLQNGDTIDAYFHIYGNGNITLVPEPATLFLLGLGAVMLRRKCKGK